MRLLHIGDTPYLLEDLAMGQDLAGMSHQQPQKVILGWGKLNLSSLGDYPSVFKINFKTVHSVDRLRRFLNGFSEGDTHPRQQLSNSEGLGNVIISPGIQGCDLLIFAVPDRQYDYRRLRPFSQPAEHFNPIHIR